ncbi:MAG: hypothetical protein IT236_07055 [Bacteroidia bacterium]|nr:hypothetical protein [Bacteroidia bacterium]
MEGQGELTLFIFLAVLFVITPAAIIISSSSLYKRRLKEKEAKIKEIEYQKQIEGFKLVVEAEERERDKIAKNLHDGVIPGFCAIQSNLETHTNELADERHKAKFYKDINTLSKKIAEVRGITHDLALPTLNKEGLIAALEEHIDYLSEADEGEILFENKSNYENNLPFTTADQNNIFRICMELMQNLSKYAHYDSLQVCISSAEEYLIIEFIHDGIGINNEAIKEFTESGLGIGLQSLKSRSMILNANIDYSFDEHTAGIVLTVPFNYIAK